MADNERPADDYRTKTVIVKVPGIASDVEKFELRPIEVVDEPKSGRDDQA
ncbi:hypothetical protein [Dietzia maris]